MFYIRVIYDIFCFCIGCIKLNNTPEQHLINNFVTKSKDSLDKSSKLLLIWLTFQVVLEILVYFISIKSAQKRQRKVQFRLLREEITSQEANDLMLSSSDDDTFTPNWPFGGPYQMDLVEKRYKPIVLVMTDFFLGVSLMAYLIFKFQNMAYYN